ncbi:hypothetical protein BKA81DRAFT_367382 [Phyllosticta paracitricarpa]
MASAITGERGGGLDRCKELDKAEKSGEERSNWSNKDRDRETMGPRSYGEVEHAPNLTSKGQGSRTNGAQRDRLLERPTITAEAAKTYIGNKPTRSSHGHACIHACMHVKGGIQFAP